MLSRAAARTGRTARKAVPVIAGRTAQTCGPATTGRRPRLLSLLCLRLLPLLVLLSLSMLLALLLLLSLLLLLLLLLLVVVVVVVFVLLLVFVVSNNNNHYYYYDHHYSVTPREPSAAASRQNSYHQSSVLIISFSLLFLSERLSIAYITNPCALDSFSANMSSPASVPRPRNAKSRFNNCLHFSICACHPCAGAMLIFSVSFQF